MNTVSMLDFRRNAETIVLRVQNGERLILTYRGKPVARLEPIADPLVNEDDPFYRLGELADSNGKSLTNEQMDQAIYGS
jgi:prevent-host-death family protein